MKIKYIVYPIAVVVIILLIAYLLNMLQLRLEQTIGKFMTWVLVLLLVFVAGWVVGRFGRYKTGR